MNAEPTEESWHVEANDEVLDTNFAELTAWIANGTLLRIDRVKKGDLRWIEAGKVPSLLAVFNAKDNGQLTAPPVVTTTKLGGPVMLASSRKSANTVSGSKSTKSEPEINGAAVCSLHAEIPAAFVCGTCTNLFCRACPTTYGTSVKICPFCGAMCTPIATPETRPTEIYYVPTGKFGFGDFAKALAYPFMFKISLVLGSLMYVFLSVGGSATSFGGVYLMWGAIACFMLANTLTFGILANTVENFSQGKTREDFMPSFDEFSLWEDVVHPFFLMICVYISSFGPLIAAAILTFFFVIGPIRSGSNAVGTDTKPVGQGEMIKELLNKDAEQQKRNVESIESGGAPLDDLTAGRTSNDAALVGDKKIDEIESFINESRKSNLDSVIGKAPETVANERAELVKQLVGTGMLFVIAGGLCLLWAIFYFPAACAVAGYTRSVAATLNPTVGLDTIRRLGFDYLQILFFFVVLVLASAAIYGIFAALLAPFDLPGVGNIPASAIGSLFGFYFFTVFSCVLGFALYKSAEKLKLYR